MQVEGVRLLATAVRDIEEAESWYLDRSERAAEGFLREVERGLALVTKSPELWPPYEAGTRRYVLRRYPFSIIYRNEDKGIVVIAVAHHRRRPLYWSEP